MPRGKALTLRKTLKLARAWYGDQLSPDFEGRTTEQAEEIFERLGLGGPAQPRYRDPRREVG